MSLHHEFWREKALAGNCPTGVTTGQTFAASMEDSSLRIALFSGNYNCVRDGANNALTRLTHFLLDRGAAVRVYAPTCPRPAFEPVGDLIPVPSIPLPGRPEYRLALGLGAEKRRDILQFSPTVFHLSAPDLLGWQARSFARRLGIPVVASLHTRFETYPAFYGLGLTRRLVEYCLEHFYSGCDLILAPTEAMANWLCSRGMDARVRLWSRGVDRDFFSPRRRDNGWRRSLGYQDNDVILLFFGRLVLEKGLDAFAQVMQELRLRGHPLRPLVVGAGPAQPRFAAALGEAVFTGHLEGPALARAVASADILFNPSITEAFGNVTLEAMASGLAVVCADGAAARNLLGDQTTGLLVPVTDTRLCADALETLLRDPLLRRRLGQAARRRSADFDWSAALPAPLGAYHEALRLNNSQRNG